MAVNEEQLISLISNYPELYDLQNSHYMNNVRKNNIWGEIAREVGADETICKEKWKNLRDSYSRSLKKRKTKSGDGASTYKRWKYEKQMEFVRPYLQERATITNLSKNKANDNGNEDSAAEGVENGPETDTSPTPSAAMPKRMCARRRILPPQPSVANVLDKFLNDRKATVPQETGPIHSFFKAMADSVAVLPTDLQLRAKNKIFEIVSEVESANLQRNARGIHHVEHHGHVEHVHGAQHAEEPLIEETNETYEEYVEEDPQELVHEEPVQEEPIRYFVADNGFLVPHTYRPNFKKYGENAEEYQFMLFSNGLQRKCATNVAFFGFLFADIERQRQVYKKMKCCYCQKLGANISCSKRNCSSWFHLICGIENHARNQFVEPYRSYCNRHVPRPKYRPDRLETCYICLEQIFNTTTVFSPTKMLRAPCCRNGWFHIFCLQKYAQTAGNFFKCPLCNNVDRFKVTMPYWGVYVPHNPDFEADNELPHAPACSAQYCRNVGGSRQATASNPLMRCTACRHDWIHSLCRPMTHSNVLCEDCAAVAEEREMIRRLQFEINERYIQSSRSHHYQKSFENNEASKGLEWTSWIVNNVLCHPFIVFRRQCQAYSASKSYHLLPFTLVPIAIQVYKQQGSAAFWKGFGYCLLGRGISWILNKIVFFLADFSGPYLSWLVYFITKCWFIKNHVLTPVRRSEYDERMSNKPQTLKEQQLEIRSDLITNFVTEILLYPWDTILCRLQLQGTYTVIDNPDNGYSIRGLKTNYSNWDDCYETIKKKEGFAGLYKGFGALLMQFAVQYTVIKIAKCIF